MSWQKMKCWIFDLDNTLYPGNLQVMPNISGRIQEFISQHLQIPIDEAVKLQDHYRQQYGTSLRGLMLHQNVSPQDFLDYVHQVDLSELNPAPSLQKILRQLPGPKYVFTNSSAQHAQEVLGKLAIADCFQGVFDVKQANFIPKPHPEAYQIFLNKYNIPSHQSVFFEDTAINLQPPAGHGMKTVLITASKAKDKNSIPYVHHYMPDLVEGLQGVLDMVTSGEK